jgi:hypothetical protein
MIPLPMNIIIPGWNNYIKTDSIKYYEDRKDRFSPRSGIYKEEIKM